MLSREDVISAYRAILGRDPENEDAIAFHCGLGTLEDVRQELVKSAEFHRYYEGLGNAPTYVPVDAAFPPLLEVETEAEGDARQQMWAGTAESWRKLGEEAPHWSVLSADKYLPDNLEENRAEFKESAQGDLRLLDAALARLPDAEALRAGTCLEVGCGVGRATAGLARRFDSVVGVDVSAPHLEIARQELAAAGKDNVNLRRIARIEDYDALAGARFFYSRIVLQHNPPPIQAAILRSVLSGLAAPGAALFQAITQIDGYRFTVRDYLDGKTGGMEMHVFPQSEIFRIFEETGCRAVEVHRDFSGGKEERTYQSYLFLAYKPG